MPAENSRHLRIKCGPYGILIDIACVVEIIKLGSEKSFLENHNSNGNLEKIIRNEQHIPYVDMYSLLDIGKKQSTDPQYAIVLSDALSVSRLAAIYVDEVYDILETEMEHWHLMQGINSKLDDLFDMAYAHKNDEILMRLNPTQKWLN